MKSWLLCVSLVSISLGFAACSGDDDDNPGTGGGAGTGGSSNMAGSGGKGGSGGASEAGASGAAGAAGAPVMCDPPAPPTIGEGGATGAAGASAGGEGGTPAAAGASAGGEGGTPAAAGASGVSLGVAIAGKYADAFGGKHEITNSEWKSDSAIYHISQFDNAGQFLIARNDQTNQYNPCLWSRFDWTTSKGKLY